MDRKLDRRLSQSAPCLDFKTIESSEVTLDRLARQRIRRACIDFLSVAIKCNAYPPFDAATCRKTARAICRKAATARRALSDLILCLFDAVTHEFTLPEPIGSNGFVLSLRRAIEVVDNVGAAAEKRFCEVHARGRPELRDFKKLVIELYCIFRASGGEGRILWDKNRQCYKGYPLYFIRRVLEHVRPLMPVLVKGRLLPSKDSAITRTAAEAIRTFDRRRQKTQRKEKTIGHISASLRIRHQVQRDDTVHS
ncbi:MAG: hypothetical protein ABSG17_09135 [Spirochaetia bacterium]